MTSVTSQAQQYSQRKQRLKRWVFRRLQKTGRGLPASEDIPLPQMCMTGRLRFRGLSNGLLLF